MKRAHISLHLVRAMSVLTVAGLISCGRLGSGSVLSGVAFSGVSGPSFEGRGSGQLYVLSNDGRSGTVAVFGGSPLKLIRSFGNGLDLPYDMTFNTHRQLAISNYFGADVTIYSATGNKPVRTLSKMLRNARLLAAAPDNDLYVAGQGHVMIFPDSQQHDVKEIRKSVAGLTVDTDGNAYVAGYPNTIFVYRSGATQPSREITQGLSAPTYLLVDYSGNLYVANDPSSGCGDVTVYEAATGMLKYTISSGICEPARLAVDTAGNLFVSNHAALSIGGQTVTEYSAGTNTLTETISNGIINPWSLATDSAGNLYVGNDTGATTGYVTVYPPSQTFPSETLTKAIHSPNTLLWLDQK